MSQILLIIALIIAIILDCVRIVQYIKMRKNLDPKTNEEIANKINRIYSDWISDEDSKESLGQYCIKHWNDEQR